MPSVWGLYPRFERSRGLNAKGLQSLGNSPGLGIVSEPVRIGQLDASGAAMMAEQGA
jgi:hypothetical protein